MLNASGELVKDSDLLKMLNSFLIDCDDETPKYQNVAKAFHSLIDEGILTADSTLPGERNLAMSLNVSRVTIRKAVDVLTRDGLLIRRHGAKTIVANRIPKFISNLTSFSEEVRSRGVEPSNKWLSKEIVTPDESEIINLELNDKQLIVKLFRLRFANAKPIALELAIIPQSILFSPDLVGESLYSALEKLEAFPVDGVQKISAINMNKKEAKLLDSKIGTAMLVVERKCYLANGQVVEFTITKYKAEAFDFITKLQK